MRTTSQIENERAGLEEQQDKLSNLIARLRSEHAHEAGTTVKFHLEQQIEQFERELLGVQEKLNNLDSQRLYNALLTLNFQAQAGLFRQFTDQHRVGAFLIHGPDRHGQRWLLNRLLRRYVTTANVIPISLSRRSRGTDLLAIWKELGGKVGLSSPEPEAVVERLRTLWANQNVVLLFHDIAYLTEPSIRQFITEFWENLARACQDAAPPGSDFKLLMFLIDYDGDTSEHDLGFADALHVEWQPISPFRMPVLSRIPSDALSSWIEHTIDDLPIDLFSKGGKIVQEILQRTDNGIPEDVLEEICRLCDSSWYEREGEWQKY